MTLDLGAVGAVAALSSAALGKLLALDRTVRAAGGGRAPPDVGVVGGRQAGCAAHDPHPRDSASSAPALTESGVVESTSTSAGRASASASVADAVTPLPGTPGSSPASRPAERRAAAPANAKAEEARAARATSLPVRPLTPATHTNHDDAPTRCSAVIHAGGWTTGR